MLEEVVLLAVDEGTGHLRSTREYGTAYALVGAVFFDLALARKIDTDTEAIRIVDAAPTGNTTLDGVLSDMACRPDLATVRQWIEEIFQRRQDLEGAALASLIASGILRHEKSKRLWIIDVERFPLVNGRHQENVKQRLRRAIPRRRHSGHARYHAGEHRRALRPAAYLLTEAELAARRKRVGTLCNLETISRKMIAAIDGLDASLRSAAAKMM